MIETLATRTLITGTFGSFASTLGLMVAAKAEGLSPWQPTNATAHWLHGPIAAAVHRADPRFTGVGYATHHGATTFWALGYELWAGSRVTLTPASALRGALATSAIAAVVDYTITPKRFTPGWELILSKRGMALAYVAMALGFAGSALIGRTRARGERRRISV